MSSDWAREHLQVIRTLMERSALYRRALAPIFFTIGAIGVVGATIPCFVAINGSAAFTGYWLGIGISALTASLLLVRGQALREKDTFWSPPTRRVTAAVFPPFFLGFFAGLIFLWPGLVSVPATTLLAGCWMICYGLGLHAAGFFMTRGIKLFGWIFIGAGLLVVLAGFQPRWAAGEVAHYAMGVSFGLLHLLAGIYLRWTERRRDGG